MRERRHFFRLEQLCEAQYRLVGELGIGWCPAHALNLSVGGMRLKGREPLEAGAAVELQLELPHWKQRLLVQGRVVWSQLRAAGVYEHGVEFLNVSTEQQMQIDRLVQFLKPAA